jgi:DNA-binding CsgD family transcriptional regulator
MSRINTSAIAAAFAEAAVDPSRWVGAMDVAAEAAGGRGAMLIPGAGGAPPIFPFSESIGSAVECYFRDGWVHRDKRYSGTLIMRRRGVCGDLEFTDADAMRSDPYYQDFLGRHGLRWFAAVKVAVGDDLWALSIQRTIEQGPFSLREQRQLADLSPKLSTAALLARSLGFARAEAALDAFDVSGHAAVLFDRFGRVFRINNAAEQHIGGDLQITRKELICSNSEAQAALSRAVRDVMWSGSPAALLPPVALPRAGKRPLIAYVARLAGVSADALAPCQAIAILVDLDKNPRPPETILRSAFRLTAAEARLAMQLASGRKLESAADELGIAYETARSHLKLVLAKTDTRRQAELVALMARMLPGQSSD